LTAKLLATDMLPSVES